MGINDGISDVKKCSKCLIIKNRSDFSKSKSKPDGLQFWCKLCHCQTAKEYHRRVDKSVFLKRNSLHKKRICDAVDIVKAINGCAICKESDASCLDFHHIDAKSKIFTIGSNKTISINRLIQEIKKCEILCSNCHRKIHKNLINLPSPRLLNINEVEEILLNKNIRPRSPSPLCLDCGKIISSKKYARCHRCANNKRIISHKIFFISHEELNKIVWNKPISEIAKIYNVSENSIHKRCKKYNIQKPPAGYWLKSHHTKQSIT